MNKFILGTKGPMTQIFTESGTVHPVTVLRVEPNVVTQIKTHDQDGYWSVQVATGVRKAKNTPKPQQGHITAATGDSETFYRHMREFRIDEKDAGALKVGEKKDVSVFEVGDEVHISAQSKGKGFQGVVKRHNFAGGPRSHGQKHTERAPGSAGATGPARVFPGQKMPGRMGNDRVTVKNLTIVHIDADRGELYVRGAVPGIPGNLVEIKGRVNVKKMAVNS